MNRNDSVAVLRELVDRFPEINPSNYDHDDVCALNAWGVEVCAAIDALSAQGAALDPQLAAFYQVDSVAGLLAAMEEHIDRLQESARRNVKPWEDTFPPTLLPKYLRDHGLPEAPAPTAVVHVHTTTSPGGVGDAVTEDDISRIEFAVENMRLADPSEEQIEARWNLAYRLGEIAKKLRAALAARTGKGEANGR